MSPEEIRAWVARTRAAQQLPRHVEDDQVLTDLAHAITESTPSADAQLVNEPTQQAARTA